MSNLIRKNRYTGKKSGDSFDRAKGSSRALFRAKINLTNMNDRDWVSRGGWSVAQVRRTKRECLVILGREAQRERNKREAQRTGLGLHLVVDNTKS